MIYLRFFGSYFVLMFYFLQMLYNFAVSFVVIYALLCEDTCSLFLYSFLIFLRSSFIMRHEDLNSYCAMKFKLSD
jgi:hypothetical protein